MKESEFFGRFRSVSGGGNVKLSPDYRHLHVSGSVQTTLQMPDARRIPTGASVFTVWNDSSANVVYPLLTITDSGIQIEFPDGGIETWEIEDGTGTLEFFDIDEQTSGVVEMTAPPPTGVLPIDDEIEGNVDEVESSFGSMSTTSNLAPGKMMHAHLVDNSTAAGVWSYEIHDFDTLAAPQLQHGLFLAGGNNTAGAAQTGTVRFDAASAVWYTMAAAPIARANAAGLGLEDAGLSRYYLAGGSGNTGTNSRLSGGTWATGTAPAVGIEQSASWGRGGLGYIHGGATDSDHLQRLTASSNVWATLANSTTGRTHHTGGLLGFSGVDDGYVTGAVAGSDGALVQRWTASSNTWSSALAQRPGAINIGMTSASMVDEWGTAGRLFLGGLHGSVALITTSPAEQAWELRGGATVLWHARPNCPAALYTAAAVSSSTTGRVYLCGGTTTHLGAGIGSACYSWAPGDVWRREADLPIARGAWQSHGGAGLVQ